MRFSEYSNAFHAFDIFLYPLKTSENIWFSDNFKGVDKGNSSMRWVNGGAFGKTSFSYPFSFQWSHFIPLKISENLWSPDVFRGIKREYEEEKGSFLIAKWLWKET